MRILLFSLMVGLLMSCGAMHDKQSDEINAALSAVNKSFSGSAVDSANIQKAEDLIPKFVEQYPKDSLTPKYLFQLGLLYQKQRRFEDAIKTLDRVYQQYPDSKEAPNSVFLQGFLYTNVLNNLDKGKEKYQLYLDKYSNVDPKVTSDVQLELQNLGKSPDEILKEIQDKAKADSTMRPS